MCVIAINVLKKKYIWCAPFQIPFWGCCRWLVANGDIKKILIIIKKKRLFAENNIHLYLQKKKEYISMYIKMSKIQLIESPQHHCRAPSGRNFSVRRLVLGNTLSILHGEIKITYYLHIARTLQESTHICAHIIDQLHEWIIWTNHTNELIKVTVHEYDTARQIYRCMHVRIHEFETI